MTELRLSVIIASYNAKDTIVACLQSLYAQTTHHSFEIILIDSSMDGTGDLVETLFPRVNLHRFKERKFCGDARNIGISVASGDIVAFIDADCRAAPGWVDNIIKAHDSPHLAIGGTISNGNPESKVGWAAYFTEFSKWMPGIPGKMMSDIAGANISYKIEAFKKYGRFIQGTYCSDTEFNWRIGRHGYQLQFEPSIMVYHRNIEQLSTFIRHEVFHGLCFARVRIRAHSFSTMKRVLYGIASPLIAIKLIIETVNNTRCRRTYFKQFLRNLGLTILGVSCWCAGEAMGYLEKKK